MDADQIAIVLGPVAITAILGPALLMLMNKAKNRAESENYEVLSDKARFEAMDLLVNHLRQEVDRLRNETASERTEASTSRKQIQELEEQIMSHERTAVDVALWALSLIGTMEKAGLPAPSRPPEIAVFLDRLKRPTFIVTTPEARPPETLEDS